jgi:serine-type D-Ala-D-Ala carboxypeptidase/endopeptidase (penicillin-binding protein 4)
MAPFSNMRILLTFIFIVISTSLVLSATFFYFNPSPPVLNNHQIIFQEDNFTSIDLLKINKDLNGFKLQIVGTPKNGNIEGSLPYFFYRPNKDYFGYDAIQYQAKLKDKKSNVATISFDIKPENDRPIAENTQHVVKEDESINFYLKANDPDNDFLSYKITRSPIHGKIRRYGQKIVYMSSDNYFGDDYLTFSVSDRDGKSDSGEVKLTILPVNDPPISKNSTQNINSKKEVPLQFKVEDIDSKNTEIKIVKKNYLGKIIKSADGFYYQASNQLGSYSENIQFYALDSENQSNFSNLEVVYTKPFDLKLLKKKLIQKYPNAGIAVSISQKDNLIINDHLFVPASLIKIATATAALFYLEANHRFKTEVYKDKRNNIYIKGYGNPVFSGHDLDDIVKVILKSMSPEQTYQLIIDGSVFNGKLSFRGQPQNDRYYNAPVSALATNYNTAYINIKDKEHVTSLYSSTPITPSLTKRVKKRRGVQFFSIAANSDEGNRYTGELLEAKLKHSYLTVNTSFKIGKTPKAAKLIYTHYSKKDLTAIIRLMLKTSNNFIANQLLLAIAYKSNPQKVSIDAGAKTIERFLITRVGLSKKEFSIVEGSGISRQNKFRPSALLKLLDYSKRLIDLFPNIKDSNYPGLSKLGNKNRIFAKTGTLVNVSNLAGYYRRDNKWISMVVMSDHQRSIITADLLKN